MKIIYLFAKDYETKGMALAAFAMFHLAATLGYIPAMFRTVKNSLNGLFNMQFFNVQEVEGEVIKLFPPATKPEVIEVGMQLLYLLTDNAILGCGMSDVITITPDAANLMSPRFTLNYLDSSIPAWLAKISNHQCDYPNGTRYKLNSNVVVGTNGNVYLPKGLVISQYCIQPSAFTQCFDSADISMIESFIHEMLPETNFTIRFNQNGSIDIWDFLMLHHIR